MFWNERMFMLHGDFDTLMYWRKFYTTVNIRRWSRRKSLVYTNAMQIKAIPHPSMGPERSSWLPCLCCPTNLVRLLPSISSYVYAQKMINFVNLWINNRGNAENC